MPNYNPTSVYVNCRKAKPSQAEVQSNFFTLVRFLFFICSLSSYAWRADFARIGLGICYDIRFAEIAAILARRGPLLFTSEIFSANSLDATRMPCSDLPRCFQLDDGTFALGAPSTSEVCCQKIEWGLHTSHEAGLSIIKSLSPPAVPLGSYRLDIMRQVAFS